jgi:phosphoglucomutase
LDQELKNNIEQWVKFCPFPNLVDEIKDLQKQNNEKELIDRFYKDIEFGTGGMRAVMAAGPNRMNEEVVGKTTQGLANYILSQGGQEFANRGVAIAHDSRINHKKYLQEIASVFAGNGIKVHLFEGVRPTPLLSYAVRTLKAVAGIVITASHNTSEYNGYKVYWVDGGQIIPPHDTNIIAEVRKVKSYKQVNRVTYEDAVNHKFVNIISAELIQKYYTDLKRLVLRPDLLTKHAASIKIIYTPLHGASGNTVMGMFEKLGFTNVLKVPEQFEPDGLFPTVASPNPEEASALAKALELAKKENADLLFANDPDGDRMAVGVKTKNNEWVLLNGNQVGSIMAWYILMQKKNSNQLPTNGCIVKTIVTTELQTEIAKVFQIKTFNTLTGFKYIGGLIQKFEIEKANGQKTFEYIFGGEESYGYLPCPIVRDKDGVMSIGLAAEIATYAKENNKTLIDILNQIYTNYGLYQEDLISITLKGKDGLEKMDRIMGHLRNNPPISLNQQQIIEIKDYLKSETKDGAGNLKEKINLPTSNVLEFNLSDGTRVTARPSGTEPKIKFYFSVNTKTNLADIQKNTEDLKIKLNSLKKELENIVVNF